MSRQFEVLAGKYHAEGDNGRTYTKGQIVPSNRDLVKVFGAQNFREVVAAPGAVAAVASAAAPAAVTGLPPAGGAPAASTGALGEDVTEDFDLAKEAELKVFKKGNKFFVTQPNATDKALNTTALKLREVDGFVEKLLKKG